MRLINPKRIVASTIVFLFTSLSNPGIDAKVDQMQTMPITSNEVVSATLMPSIDTGIPRVVNLATSGDMKKNLQGGGKAIIRSVDYSYNLINDLKKAPLLLGHDIMTISREAYGNQAGTYVNMSSTDLQTGCIKIANANTHLENNLKSVLANPSQYKVRPDLVNVQLAPKMISDTISGSTLLAMEAWDFRLASQTVYSDVAINQMLTNAYSTFKSFATIQHKLHQGSPVVIHTSFWGTNYNNNAKVTTAIQLIAAHLAGIDKIIFHTGSQNPDTNDLYEAQDFVRSQQGKSVAEVMVNLLQQSKDVSWQAGHCTIASFSDPTNTNDLLN